MARCLSESDTATTRSSVSIDGFRQSHHLTDLPSPPRIKMRLLLAIELAYTFLACRRFA